MSDVKLDASTNQFDFSSLWDSRLLWRDCYQTVLPFDLKPGASSTPERSNTIVVKAVIKQISYFGEVFRCEVEVSADAYIWRQLSNGWKIGKKAS